MPITRGIDEYNVDLLTQWNVILQLKWMSQLEQHLSTELFQNCNTEGENQAAEVYREYRTILYVHKYATQNQVRSQKHIPREQKPKTPMWEYSTIDSEPSTIL